jgi:tetratricopeptide (TPR) repeat protein
MKKTMTLFVICLLFLPAYSQKQSEKYIPITTNSEKALSLYNEAVTAYKDVYIAKFNSLLGMALKEDPDFFMANYMLGILSFYVNREQNFVKFATAASNCKAKLSPGEIVLKDMLSKLLEDRKADLTVFGKKLVDMFPQDEVAFMQLGIAQTINKDFDGAIATYRNALKVAGRKDYIYNVMAYAQMEAGKYDDALVSLDKYIETAPRGLPNPYDSKGDYYMKVKDYNKAYEYYMKAYQIDTLWSKNKAKQAKAYADSLLKK